MLPIQDKQANIFLGKLQLGPHSFKIAGIIFLCFPELHIAKIKSKPCQKEQVDI